MENIKFRAWDKENQRFGYLSHPFDNNWYVEPSEYGTVEVAFPNNWKDKDGYQEGNLKIMQYTGLLDRNGTEIYEGDILRLWRSVGQKGQLRGEYAYLLPVKYEPLWCQFVADDEANKEMFGIWQQFGAFEVVGNIYENPELLIV